MSERRFEWDPQKAAVNLAKHGVPFDEALTVFGDESGIVRQDPDHSMVEDRFLLIGLSAERRVLIVVHCVRDDGCSTRLISARQANRWERQQHTRRDER